MAPMSQKKRRLEDGMRGKTERPKKRFRKQAEYHSSSENDSSDEGFTPMNLADSGDETQIQSTRASKKKEASGRTEVAKKADSSSDDATGEESDSAMTETTDGDGEIERADNDDEDEHNDHEISLRKPRTKRNDPSAFSTSIQKILSTKLSAAARSDPILSRSKDANAASKVIANSRLEARARAKIRRDRKEELERGRDKDILGLNSGKAGEVAEEEKRLRKIAQRGVVKLFNAVRAAQVSAEKAAKEERKKGTIGMGNREEKVNEMSKQGFLDFIGGKKPKEKKGVAAEAEE